MGFMDIIPATEPKHLTSDTTFSNYILIAGSYSKITKLYGLTKFSTEEVMDKLDIFQSRFGKIDKFGWWGLEIILVDVGMQIYLHVVQRIMSKSRSSFDFSRSGTSGN